MSSKRLRELRVEKRLSQQDIADDLKLCRSTYATYENNKARPDFETLLKLADYYNVTTDYLLGRSNLKQYDTEIEKLLSDPEIQSYIDLARSLKDENSDLFKFLFSHDVKKYLLFAQRLKKSNIDPDNILMLTK